ncbi:cyanate transporter [Paludibacterium paludis]|uniref:MFS transporter n=1 Tax=Paludibacterium paludis TaxID=1225769 RepID=A0A918U976_9NEIS|nr:cyanate transporter [Paludibacterium paludis]GGY11993.1 MFS transporter [Paludibacterium paludis]
MSLPPAVRSSSSLFPMVLALILAGLNLRPSMAAIGPLLTPIRASLPLSFTLISLLTMLPVLAMGLAMSGGGRLAARLGEHRAVALSLAVIGLSSLARLWADDAVALILTAVTAGAGIAVIQAVMPGIIKHHFPGGVALLMGLYVTSIMGGAAIAAAASPFVESYGGWHAALAVWSGLAALALAAWYAVRRQVGGVAAHDADDNEAPESFARNPRAWLLGVFFGLGTASYTCVLAWLPPYFVEMGWKDTQAGLMLAFLTSMEVLSGLVLPTLAQRATDRRPILFAALAGVVAGFSGLLLAPTALPMLWTGLLGFGIGGVFPLTLIITMDHIASARRAGRLAAFVQGTGYFIAAFSPMAAGAIRDATHGFAGAWLLLLAVTLGMLFMASRFDPARYEALFARA